MAMKVRGRFFHGGRHFTGELCVEAGTTVSVDEGPWGGLNEETGPCMEYPSEDYLVPGLFDAHVHLRSEQDIEDSRTHGVYGLRDAGSRQRTGLGLGHRQRISSAGSALVPDTGYGGFLGIRISSLAECRRVLGELEGLGIRYVKVIGSGLVSRDTGDVEPGGFPAPFLEAIIREAGTAGFGVSVHANGDEAIRSAVRAGAQSVEHGFLMTRQTMGMLADRGVYWVPTVYALAGVSPSMFPDHGGSPALRAVLKQQLINLSVAAEIGVKVALGTDAGSPGIRFGEAVVCEMNWWRRAGLSLQDILMGAVVRSSELCGLEEVAYFREGAPLSLVRVHEGDELIRAHAILFEGRRLGRGGREQGCCAEEASCMIDDDDAHSYL